METSLSIAEKIYLFSVHPEKGGIVAAAYNTLVPVLTGAVLFDLIASKKLTLEEKRIILNGNSAFDPLQAFVLEKIATASKPRTAQFWIHKFSWSSKKIKAFIKESLKQKRLLRIEQRQFLFFRWDKVFLTDRVKVTGFISEIETQIKGGGKAPVDDGLLSLLIPSELLKRMFPDREKRKNIKARLKQMQLENVVSKAVADVIRMSRAAAVS
jgi:hypothetical protein